MPEAAEGPDPKEVITLAQAGREAGLSLSTMQTLRRRGVLACTKLGRDWTLTRAELHRYLLRRGMRGNPAPLPITYRTPRGMQPIAIERE